VAGVSPTVELALLAHAVDRSPDGVVIVDAEGVIRYANPAMGELTLVPPDALVGRSVDELVPAASHDAHAGMRHDFARSAVARPMGAGRDLGLVRADGSEVPVEISLSPFHHDGTSYVVATVRDISERLENLHRLAQADLLLHLAEERERIGRDLHDVVLQHLYGMGLTVQAIGVAAADDIAARLEPVIGDIDRIISEVRTIVFTLGPAGRHGNLGQDLADVMAQSSRVLGFTPSLRLEGPVDSVITDDIRTEMIASMREALGNVARHAEASSVSVVVGIDENRIAMTVTDNGIGPPENGGAGGHGLDNMRQRAGSLGGTCELAAGPQAGAQLRWTVPFA
jgi:two-component system, NarL family, sensor histidine kinase DevS